jgi:hypothetical protein
MTLLVLHLCCNLDPHPYCHLVPPSCMSDKQKQNITGKVLRFWGKVPRHYVQGHFIHFSFCPVKCSSNNCFNPAHFMYTIFVSTALSSSSVFVQFVLGPHYSAASQFVTENTKRKYDSIHKCSYCPEQYYNLLLNGNYALCLNFDLFRMCWTI